MEDACKPAKRARKPGSRWKEDKVLTSTSCLKGDGGEKPPTKLLSTCVATMEDARAFGPLARLEAERRGIRNAVTVIGIHDGGNWIDPLWQEYFGCHQRILDYCHASEHLHEAARAAATALGSQPYQPLAEQWTTLLWNGKIDALLARLEAVSSEAGKAAASDLATDPRVVLARTVGYVQKHRDQMNYPTYRARGWPIASGITETGVKLFGKRVKGSEQFWNVSRAEAILALRSKWLSEDEPSQYYCWGEGQKRWPHNLSHTHLAQLLVQERKRLPS